MSQNAVQEKSIEFSLDLIKYVELLEKRNKYVIANQLLRSGTSIGANIAEAQNAQSRKDFLHKLKVASKELEETKYWLILCKRSDSYPNFSGLDSKLEQIGLILFKIIATTTKNLKN